MKIQGINETVEKEIIDLARKHHIKKITVFGSRARDDYQRTSDIDLAVTGGNISAFATDVEEETTTLLEYDIVNLDGKVQQELLDSIEKEGVVVYEEI